MATCCGQGPGYATPLDAHNNGAREKTLYVPAIIADGSGRPDYLATVDVDEASPTFSQVVHRLPMPHEGDELHHSGWNACSSCHGDASKKRNLLILPAVKSGRVYAVDVSDERAPALKATVEPEAIAAATGGLAYPHTTHCLGSGEIMISLMGSKEGGGAAGGFVLLDGATLEPKGGWAAGGAQTPFGYDFWYQPRRGVMISTEFGAPKAFLTGFDPSKATTDYGSKVHLWSWRDKALLQSVDLAPDGLIPLEVRFAHEPTKGWAFVGCALSSNVALLELEDDGGANNATGSAAPPRLRHSFPIKQEWLEVEGWALPTLPPLITDVLLSLDDKWLFFSNWLRGDLVVYDISDPQNPRFSDRLWLGGSFTKGSGVTATNAAQLAALGLSEQPAAPVVKGVTLQGGPQMIQLSLDGRRLYVTNSLLSPWDKQFYPNLVSKGSQLVRVDVSADGKLSLDEGFLVDFGAEPGGPALAHEVRYPGGDSSSDIWL